MNKNLPPKIITQHNPFSLQETFTHIEKMTTPQILNGNLVMPDGQVMNSTQLNETLQRVNSSATPVQTLGNGNVLLSNGNTINPAANSGMSAAAAGQMATPVNVLPNGNIQMANGNTVNPNSLKMANCSIPNPPPTLRYCRPAPYHSMSGEKYFYLNEAYGKAAQW
jgi:hypothetical protein